MSPDEIKIPPEPPGRCSNHLQVGISPLFLKIKACSSLVCVGGGAYLGTQIRNPALKLEFCHADFVNVLC